MSNKVKNILTWTTFSQDNKGVFKCKLHSKMPESKFIQGTTKDGEKYEHYAYISKLITGRLVWIDIIDGKYGKTIRVVLKTEKGIHQLDIPYRIDFLSDVMNRFKAIGKDIFEKPISISYAIFTKDKDGKPLLSKKTNEPTTKRNIFIYFDGKLVSPYYTKERPKPEETKWNKNAEGKWDFGGEFVFWCNSIVSIQKLLVEKEIAIPLSYNSLLFTKEPSDFYKTHDENTVVKGMELYTSSKSDYKYLYGSSNASDSADDVFGYFDADYEDSSDTFAHEDDSLTIDADPFDVAMPPDTSDDIPF